MQVITFASFYFKPLLSVLDSYLVEMKNFPFPYHLTISRFIVNGTKYLWTEVYVKVTKYLLQASTLYKNQQSIWTVNY